MVFRGNSPAKIDSQGRLKIPAAHRSLLEQEYGRELYVTSLTGANVLIYPLREWELIEDKLLEPPKMQPAKMRFVRNTAYYGQLATLDRQGRVVIQAHLREAASVAGEVAVIGYLNYLEVWNHEHFQELLRSRPYSDDDAVALAELGL